MKLWVLLLRAPWAIPDEGLGFRVWGLGFGVWGLGFWRVLFGVCDLGNIGLRV